MSTQSGRNIMRRRLGVLSNISGRGARRGDLLTRRVVCGGLRCRRSSMDLRKISGHEVVRGSLLRAGVLCARLDAVACTAPGMLLLSYLRGGRNYPRPAILFALLCDVRSFECDAGVGGVPSHGPGYF